MTKKNVIETGSNAISEESRTKTSCVDSLKLTKKSEAKASSDNFRKLLLIVSLAVVATAVGFTKYANVSLQLDGFHSLKDRFLGLVDSNPEMVLDKYKTDLTVIQVRHLVSDLQCSDLDYAPKTLNDGKVISVLQAMEAKEPMGSDRVFFMLNGANEGVYVSWNGNFECMGQAAEFAAARLGADRDVMANGVRLYNQLGWPVRNAKELLEAKQRVHILLDFQLWQWPGITKGHTYVLENGVTLTTLGISPKVFDVAFFFNQEEADKIIEIGLPQLNRSKVDSSNSSSIVSETRTSHTSFLPDSLFTRDFRKRSALVARLPSPSYTERMQLVRYGAGEFYRQHFDTFHSRDFVPKKKNPFVYDDYVVWTTWAADKLRSLDQEKVPEMFQEGGPLFPDANDTKIFPSVLLGLFCDYMNKTNRFQALYDPLQEEWIRTSLNNGTENIMEELMEETRRPTYLPQIIQTWEAKLGLGELHYTIPKFDMNAISLFFYWVRWAKERVEYLGDKVPAIARRGGTLYPKFTIAFQETLLGFILDDYSQGFIVRLTNVEWYDWMVFNRGRNNVLSKVLQVWPQFAELVIRTWETRVGIVPELRFSLPRYVQHFQPQRLVTLFLYLNNQTKAGGETVFPFSVDRFSNETIKRDGMTECSRGLAVPPIALHASLFYVQTPEGIPDTMSRHGGCPPQEGVKWGANSFMWDSDAEEGANLWTTK
ncbi:hypothetical protein CCR75_004233 [Bremia lactucae]|uniref:Prolyl 4-hydroxylase alpha subunit domain-containing protein n=1 Tax=Bremia lactucae TaxID=4779 RepID=A0A976FQB5_BRELC|nr:hypothetical protein CCR75_004233 [Bremia lactucae]